MNITATQQTDAPVREGVHQSAYTWQLALAAITLLALIVRWPGLDQHSLWYDEAVAEDFTHSSFADIMSGQVKDRGNPPLYFLMVKGWSSVFGRTEVGLRSLSALIGFLTVPAIGLLGRRMFSANAGLLGAFLFAISPLSIELSNETRSYALLHLLAVLSTLQFLRLAERTTWLNAAGYGILLALGWYTHYYAFGLPLAHLAGIVFDRRMRRIFVYWLAAVALAVVLWLPWAPVFVDQLSMGGNLARMKESWRLQFAATPLVFGFGRTLAWRDSSTAWLGLASALAIIAFCVPAALGLRERCSNDRFRGAIAAAWLLGPILGPLALAVAGIPMYHHRYGSLALPIFVLLTGHGLLLLPARSRQLAMAFIVVVTAVSLCRYCSEPLKDDWRSAAKLIVGNIKADEVVVIDSDGECLPFLYYARSSASVPKSVFGMSERPTLDGRFPGVVYDSGALRSRFAADQTDEIIHSAGVWIGLCVPNDTADRYKSILEKRGYVVDLERAFKRVIVLHLTRKR